MLENIKLIISTLKPQMDQALKVLEFLYICFLMSTHFQEVFASCGGEICKFYARCQSQTCVCPRVCTANYNPVVGSDGITYGNMCHMHIASCEKQKLIQPYVSPTPGRTTTIRTWDPSATSTHAPKPGRTTSIRIWSPSTTSTHGQGHGLTTTTGVAWAPSTTTTQGIRVISPASRDITAGGLSEANISLLIIAVMIVLLFCIIALTIVRLKRPCNAQIGCATDQNISRVYHRNHQMATHEDGPPPKPLFSYVNELAKYNKQ